MEKDDKYYIRCIKITKTSNKNLQKCNLLFCYTGDEYESLDFKGMYNGMNSNECLEAFGDKLYKYSEKYFETQVKLKEGPSIKNKEPDFLRFHGRSTNMQIFPNKYGEKLIIGLYKNGKYVENSEYDEKSKMYIIRDE